MTEAAFADDPLRVLRLARFACELGLEPEPPTVAAARDRAAGLSASRPSGSSPSCGGSSPRTARVEGFELMDRLGLTARILPGAATRCAASSRTATTTSTCTTTRWPCCRRSSTSQADPAAVVGDEHGAAVAALLAEPLADELTRGAALRFGALLHDIAKPATPAPRGRRHGLGFPGHDEEGAEMTRAILDAPAHQRAAARARRGAGAPSPAPRLPRPPPAAGRARRIYDYLVTTATPSPLDVTLLSRRRPAGHARRQRRAGDRRRTWSSRARCCRRRAGSERRPPAGRWCAATSSPRSSASHRGRCSARCWPRSPPPATPARSATRDGGDRARPRWLAGRA